MLWRTHYSPIGLDIGSHQVKLVQLKGTGPQWTLHRTAVAPLANEEGGVLKRPMSGLCRASGARWQREPSWAKRSSPCCRAPRWICVLCMYHCRQNRKISSISSVGRPNRTSHTALRRPFLTIVQPVRTVVVERQSNACSWWPPAGRASTGIWPCCIQEAGAALPGARDLSPGPEPPPAPAAASLHGLASAGGRDRLLL